MNNQPEDSLLAEKQEGTLEPSVNIDEITVTIRRNIQQRQAANSRQATYFLEFEEATCPEEPVDGKHNPLQYFLLRELNQTFAPRFQIERNLTPSWLDKLPIIGLLWNSLRRQFHNLSFFYANQITGQMISYNRYLVTILNLMTHPEQKRNAEITQLKQQLAQLEAQLAHLEQKG